MTYIYTCSKVRSSLNNLHTDSVIRSHPKMPQLLHKMIYSPQEASGLCVTVSPPCAFSSKHAIAHTYDPHQGARGNEGHKKCPFLASSHRHTHPARRVHTKADQADKIINHTHTHTHVAYGRLQKIVGGGYSQGPVCCIDTSIRPTQALIQPQ